MPSFGVDDRVGGGVSKKFRVASSLQGKINQIEKTLWASDFSYPQLKKLAACMEVYQVPNETLLFHEGDKADYLALIIQGRVHVVKYNSRNEPKHITTLGPGKTIGEMTLIDGESRSASAVTAGDTTLMLITVDRFNRLVNEWPGVAIILVLKIAKLMSQYLRQTSGRLIDHVG